MLVYLSTTYTLYELLIINLSVHKRSANGKTPISLSVLRKIRYQQPADNVYRVLQHAVITFFNVSHAFHIPVRVPFHIPFHSALQLLQFPTTLATSMHADAKRPQLHFDATNYCRHACALARLTVRRLSPLCSTLMLFHSALQ